MTSPLLLAAVTAASLQTGDAPRTSGASLGVGATVVYARPAEVAASVVEGRVLVSGAERAAVDAGGAGMRRRPSGEIEIEAGPGGVIRVTLTY